VYQAFEVELPLRVFFEKPTVAGLADFLTSAAVAGEEVARPPLVPVSRQGQLPLSFAQERLWLLEQLDPGGTAYSMPAAFRLSGALNLSALEQSLFQLLQRHEVLRTSYAVVNEQPVQVIASGANCSLPVIDLEAHSPDEQESAVRQQIQEEHNRPFDLAQGPLFRVNLLRLASEEYVLLLVLHHSIADGLSLNILYREVATGYEAACHGEGGHRPPLPIQYADYAVWQRQCLQGAALDLLLSYWIKQLEGAPPLLALPTDFPRPPLQTHRGAHHSIQLPEPVVSSLRALSQAEGVTMFMTLLAAFVLLLSRHAGQEDIVVGTPVANRPRPELEEMIGLFLNTLVLRTNLAGDPTFRELLRRVQEICLGAYANQELPFERLVEALQPERDLSRTPLFQVFFNFVDVSEMTWTLPGLTVSPLRGAHETEKFDLTLYVFLTGTGATVRWSYNSDLFDASTIAWMADQYQTVLRHLHETPENPISTVAVLREEDRARLLAPLACDCITQPFVAFPETALAQSIPTRFEAQVHQRPDQVAVQTSQYRWTYEEVNRRANQIAHTLLAQKFPAETRVALLCAHDAPMVTAIVGVLKAGYAYVPLDPSFPPARLETIVSDAQVQAVLTESAYLPVALMLGEAAGQVLTVDEALDETNTRNPQHLVSPDILAYVLYTSGTTGVPKGVMQSHRHVLHHIRVYTNNLHLRAEDRLTLLASYGFDAAVMDLFGALLNGATLYPLNLKEADPATLSAWVQHHAITLYHSTPTVFRYWTTALNGFAPLPALRLIVLGGEAASLADFEAYQRHFGPDCLFVNGLGPTESTVSLQFVADHTTKIIGQTVPVGHPVEHTEVTLLNQEGQETEVYGEIAIRSPYVAIGYWQQPELTQRVFDPATEPGRARRYRTGDMGRRRSDGSLEFMGRKDTQVKIRGYRIELREIEAVLRQQPAVQEAVVLCREDTPGEKYLVAYVVAVKEHLASSELRAAIAVQLPEYMLPAVFVLLETFPLTPNGKIDRKALPTPEAADRTHGTNYVAPRTVLEELLVDVWQEVLQVERIGIHDHFFELGGHSLLATRVIARLRNVLDLDIPLRSLFEQPTVAEFAMAIDLQLGRLFPGLGNG
jgi:amino acid adenylation domain-containing protein